MNKFLTYIKSISFGVTICIVAMLAQSSHSFYCFYSVSGYKNIVSILESALFVFVFECFTAFYLLRGRINMAKFYSSILLVMNLYYYWMNTSGLNFVLGVFLSFIIPISIFNVAEEVANEFNAVGSEKKMIPVETAKLKREKLTKLNPEG